MTKIIQAEKSLLTINRLERYNEHFPEEINSPLFTRKRFSTAPPSPTFQRDSERLRESSSVEEMAPRRNTWTPAGHCPMDLLSRKKFGGLESRRNSGNSVQEVIEECESDEETDNDSSVDYDYIRCINCSRSSSTNSLDGSISEPHLPQIINFCYKCKHLKNPHLPAFYEGRRSSWTAGDSLGICYSPRRSRKSSLTDSCGELPMISEPSFDDEVNDTKELQMIVKQEVDKLTKFNTNSSSPRTWAKHTKLIC